MRTRKLILLTLCLSSELRDTFASTLPIETSSDQHTENHKKKHHPRSKEWKQLSHQTWEYNPTPINSSLLKPSLTPRDLPLIQQKAKTSPKHIPSQKKLEPLGKISGSSADSNTFWVGDLVYIRPNGPLQVGETYAVTNETPIELQKTLLECAGYIYPLLGKVKISGTQENLFIGTVVASYQDFGRNTVLTADLPKTSSPVLIRGPQPLRAKVIPDPSESTSIMAQHKTAFINKGSEDGIQPGMIFRVFQTKDLKTGEEFSKSGLAIEADLVISQVSETFSTATIMTSKKPILAGAEAVLLTDLSTLNSKKGFSARGSDSLEELDQIDQRDTLGSKESKELQQLENWKTPGNTPPLPAPSPQVSKSPTPLASPPPLEPAPPTATPNSHDNFSPEKLESLSQEANTPPPLDTNDSQTLPPLDATPTATTPADPGTPTSQAPPPTIDLDTLPPPPGATPQAPVPSAQDTLQNSGGVENQTLPELPPPPNS